MIPFPRLRDSLIGMLSLFFLFWGVSLLISAYTLKNPLEFVMVFFASNFIILISCAGIVFAAVRFWRQWKEKLNPT